MDLRYLFMLPVSTLVALCAQMSGIGGAAIFSPIFLLIFPLLGPDYVLGNPQQAVASALLTEVFGFLSGLIGYSIRGLVDWQTCRAYWLWTVPTALVGALIAQFVCDNVLVLRLVYATLMIGLAAYIAFSSSSSTSMQNSSFGDVGTSSSSNSKKEKSDVEEQQTPKNPDKEDRKKITSIPKRSLIASNGNVYIFSDLNLPNTSVSLKIYTVFGSFLTGMLGVGVGEVVIPQLIRRKQMAFPVAAATSVAIVVVTALTAATVQFWSLAMHATTSAEKSVVPWSLVAFTIPGVIIGGQLAPYISSRRLLKDKQVEIFVAILFGLIGAAFLIKSITSIIDNVHDYGSVFSETTESK